MLHSRLHEISCMRAEASGKNSPLAVQVQAADWKRAVLEYCDVAEASERWRLPEDSFHDVRPSFRLAWQPGI